MSEMKLSEAIRLGAMLKPQGFTALISDGKSCAIGSALDAIGQLTADTEDRYVFAKHTWPLLLTEVTHPVCGDESELAEVVWGLNDSFGWTREQIADWVETIERRADAERQPEPETVAPAVRLVPQE